MRCGLSIKAAAAACAWVFVWARGAAAAPAETRATPVVPLPPLAARVTPIEAPGQTWQQQGELSGSVPSVGAELRLVLGGGGWTLRKTMTVGRGSARSELMIWTRSKHRILVMVWEKEAGTCGFAWGEET